MQNIDPTKRLIKGNNIFNLTVIDNIDFKEMSKSGNLSYNKNLDVEIIEKEIITQCDFGCLIPPPNVVILTPTGSPNDDNKIFCITQMYKEEFSLNDDKYLNICVDEAIFRRKDCKVNNRIDPLWKLIENLVKVFQMDNYIEHELFMKNPPSQLTPEGLVKLNNAYKEELKRIKEVYRQEVIKTEWINTKRRHHLEIVKTDIKSMKPSQKRKLLKEVMKAHLALHLN
ncbi:hypothetical protein RhiirC2_718532 [Rhizophagus irregularis]|uniref:Uncharacterized protein n=1 Tax=Rhizophagus irregularis TaxID=588596 RepID=A0A2N1MI03_9GLOM|nr:hypothetical protein RhiirC2_718532 [Rhizophagus irregularis]